MNFEYSCALSPVSMDLVSSYQELENLPHLKILSQDDNTSYEKAVNFAKDLKTIVVLGTGGSSLGGQTIYHAFKKQSLRTFIFLDNIDPVTLDEVSKELDLKTTGFLVISKSGNTPETLSQFLYFKELYASKSLKDHFLSITEPKDSALTRICETYCLQSISHPLDIGGRYSVFSVVGMVPAVLMGLDAKAFKQGALTYFNNYQDESLLSVNWHYSHFLAGKTLTVVKPYCDRLKLYPVWFRQLWAESLGKEGRGLTPIDAYGTVDQHSQVQLYLDGPKDKTFTLLWSKDMPSLPPFKTDVDHASLEPLSGKTMKALYQAEYEALFDTFKSESLPIRKIEFDTLSEGELGRLFISAMIETILLAKLLNIDPFDQPAVEKGKIRTFEILKEV